MSTKTIKIYGMDVTVAIPSETEDTDFLEQGIRVSNLQLEVIDPKLEERLLKTGSATLLQTLVGEHDIGLLDLIDLPIREDIEVETILEDTPEVGEVIRETVKKTLRGKSPK